ncbi:MAG: VOC family protein [Chlorobi bacterium CHB2]|nr:VOC family protein [Chlorobi bacterium CHB2]
MIRYIIIITKEGIMENAQQGVAILRQIGQQRLASATNAQSQEDWNSLAASLPHKFPFDWGDCWRQSTEYRVCDFAAEVGFYTDILGFSILVLSDTYAMFTSPDHAFNVAFVPVQKGDETPPNAIAIEFMVNNIAETVAKLQERGISFETLPSPPTAQPILTTATFRTPNSIQLRLWSVVNPEVTTTKLVEELCQTEPLSGVT